MSKRFRVRKPWRQPGPPVLDPAPLIAELGRVADDWTVPSLRVLLERPVTPVIRAVHDMEQALRPYTLLSLFSPDLEYGIVAVFLSDGSISRLRFTNQPRLNDSLGATDGPLGWTVKPLPSLGSPLFPFRRSEDQSIITYTRVFDGLSMTPPPL